VLRRAAAIVLVLALIACGGGKDGDRTSSALSKDDAPAAVDRALLDLDDLGDGWDGTGTVAPDEEADPPDAVERCIGASVLRTLDAATLARSERRDFERDGDELFQSTRLQVRTIAVRSGEAVDPVFAQLDADGFLDCLAGQLEPQVSEGPSDLRIDAGDADVKTDDYLALDGVRSTRVAIPFHTEAPGFTFEAEMDLVVVQRDQLVSFLLTIELQGTTNGEDLARWAGLLADRQRLAQSST
jgi:hypothetical protein